MSYADITYYKTVYNGTTVPDAKLGEFLAQASDDIDQLSYSEIVKGGGFNLLTPFQQRQVQMATCFQADHLYNYGDMVGSILKGYSAGDNSVQFGGNQDIRYSRRVLDYLTPTNLLYRGL